MSALGDPAQRNVMLWRGDDDPPVVWVLGDTAPPGFFDGATFLLIVQWGVRASASLSLSPPAVIGEFTRSSEAGDLIVDAAARSISWAPTQIEFGAFPRGMPARYELKRIIAGKIRTLVWGELRFASGLLRSPEETPGPIGQGYADIQVAALRSELLAAIGGVEPGAGTGQAGDQVLTLPASEAIAGHRVVRGTLQGAGVCSVAEIADADTAIGIAVGAALPSNPVTIRYGGLMSDSTWSWTEGPVFVGLDGLLTQTPPRASFEQRVGTAISSTQVVVDIEPAFIFAH